MEASQAFALSSSHAAAGPAPSSEVALRDSGMRVQSLKPLSVTVAAPSRCSGGAAIAAVATSLTAAALTTPHRRRRTGRAGVTVSRVFSGVVSGQQTNKEAIEVALKQQDERAASLETMMAAVRQLMEKKFDEERSTNVELRSQMAQLKGQIAT